ncbi:TPA: HesA/MoeB/ThiF family protein [Candidatus Bathyarchaeota archaeon]|nr:HesA/MoeB/ThiF family protein [Candidatus Bathyarchaeota archaeon]
MERYSRQAALKKIGLDGQRKLTEARVCVIGIGGLGCVSTLQLAGMGVGYLRLVDHDVVDLTNLQRQLLYDMASIGVPKVEVAEKKLKSINPEIEIEPITMTVNPHTVKEAVEGMDVVVDGLDRIRSRYAVNEICVKLKVPYVFGSAIETYGSASTIIPRKTGCLSCFFGKVNDEELPTCEYVGVAPPILRVIASIQVWETVSLLLGQEPALANKLLFFSLDPLAMEIFPVSKFKECGICGSKAKERGDGVKYLISELCGENSFMVSTMKVKSFNLRNVAEILRGKFKIKVRSNFGLTFDYCDGVSVSFMKTGNMLIKGVKTKEEAEKIYSAVLEMVEV